MVVFLHLVTGQRGIAPSTMWGRCTGGVSSGPARCGAAPPPDSDSHRQRRRRDRATDVRRRGQRPARVHSGRQTTARANDYRGPCRTVQRTVWPVEQGTEAGSRRLVVVAVDRLGRSVREVATALHELTTRGIHVRSLREGRPIPVGASGVPTFCPHLPTELRV